jgi:hypothetical protein
MSLIRQIALPKIRCIVPVASLALALLI